ncbi:hypothetical protein EUGRSUZ_H00712 [Eucalyptus grandis]|uniref:Uncharacterized protein n=2 Tax=Eucalyptus grandis TaxID=71139 RepID=A0ACC3JNE2_EUCGR|nr:hypothetical protein EUGRSUZ_H00712 [Eucalyptus grandis]
MNNQRSDQNREAKNPLILILRHQHVRTAKFNSNFGRSQIDKKITKQTVSSRTLFSLFTDNTNPHQITKEPRSKNPNLRDIPGLRLGDGDDHTLEILREHHLAPQPRVLVQNPSPRVPLQHVLLVVAPRGEPLEPLLRDVDLALRGAGVDLLQPVRRRVDEAAVGQGLQEGMPGEADDLALAAVDVDGEELDDAIGDLRGGDGGGGGGGGGRVGRGGGGPGEDGP